MLRDERAQCVSEQFDTSRNVAVSDGVHCEPVEAELELICHLLADGVRVTVYDKRSGKVKLLTGESACGECCVEF